MLPTKIDCLFLEIPPPPDNNITPLEDHIFIIKVSITGIGQVN